jgi:hypothetical protein
MDFGVKSTERRAGIPRIAAERAEQLPVEVEQTIARRQQAQLKYLSVN